MPDVLVTALANPVAMPPEPAPPPNPAQNAPAKMVPPVVIRSNVLHRAGHFRYLNAPLVLGFSLWMAAMLSAMLFSFALRSVPAGSRPPQLGVVQLIMPVVGLGIGSLLGVLMLAATTEFTSWFLPLWMFLWLSSVALAWCFIGCFNLIGPFALLIVLPLVFYQQLLSGVNSPVDTIPSWISWLDGAVPAPEIVSGIRKILIGGPESDPAWGFLGLILGVGFVFSLGTFFIWSKWGRAHQPAPP